MANGKTISHSMDEQALARLAQALASFSIAADTLRKQIMTVFPAKYGSDLWWEKEEAKVDEQLKKGQYKKFSSMDEAIRHLESL